MLRIIVNIVTTSLVFFNTYNQFKVEKDNKNLKKIYNIYFKVMCIFLILDNLLSFILRFIPFYQFFKLILIIWMSVPKCSGSIFIYRFYVTGFMRRYEEELDEKIQEIKRLVVENIKKYKEYAYGKLKEKKKEEEDSELRDVVKGTIEEK
ncbi:putative receptor expression-enhancing protein [Vairimorpha necatrix]|uniref:Protein YOP1 n=1 Tax=Vairimorpha necatrix TaxID=6039 RepID=A0AAX4JE84_9MICR